LTTDLSKCKTCQVWKDTKGKGNKSCLRCNPFREILENIRPLDCVPDEVIEQYPDLRQGKIQSGLQAVYKLPPLEYTLFWQSQTMTKKEIKEFWEHPPCLGYSQYRLNLIVKRALKSLQKIVKK
jgi:hypothetical protein